MAARDPALRAEFDVCMITTRHPLKDHRVYHKEARSLADQLGLRVLVLAICDEDCVVVEDGVVLWGIAGSQRHVLRSVLRIARALRSVRARVYHIHDFEDLSLTPFLRFVRRRPVIYDVHEDYGLMVRTLVDLPALVRPIIERVVDGYEYALSALVDRVVIVEEAQLERFKRFPVDLDGVVILRNLVSRRMFRADAVEKRFELAYCGTCNPQRGLHELVDAVALGKQQGLVLRVLLILSGKQTEIESLRSAIERQGVEPQFEIRHHLPYDQVAAALSEAKIGVLLFRDVPKYRVGIPTKLHEYGILGLPALSNDVNRYSVDYIEKHGGGVIVQGLAPESILEGYRTIAADLEQHSNTARAAVTEHIWEAEEEKLFAIYRPLLGLG